MAKKKLGVIDLFSGIGGLSHGFYLENIPILAGIDFDPSCKYAFEINNKSRFICKSITDVKKSEINNLFLENKIDTRILVGCAPCQPFSSYTFKDKVKSNEKWTLLYDFIRIIRETKPEIVSMENVPQLLNFTKDNIFENFVTILTNEGYNISYSIINCPDYGIPQKRKRLVLLASLLGKIEILTPTHNRNNYVTVKETISKLKKLDDGEYDKKDKLHFARKLSSLNKKRIESTPYGGSWKDWSEDLKLECHKKNSGRSYTSVYGRMKWDEPSPTITTHCIGFGNGRFGHPEQHRAISLREAALLQSFPKEYKFMEDEDNFSSVKIARQIGNAVPVTLGRIIAQSIKKHLKNYN
jgi:DNA (cytosine-5)-methyltransferase 1